MYLPKIVLDLNKAGTPEALTVDGEPLPFDVIGDPVPEAVILDSDDGFGYLTVGLLGYIEVRDG